MVTYTQRDPVGTMRADGGEWTTEGKPMTETPPEGQRSIAGRRHGREASNHDYQ